MDAAFERLDRYVERRLGAAREPGLVLAVTDRERTIWEAVYGYANLGARTPVTRDTLFEIGSIGKVFTGVLIQQLREEGRVDLEAPVDDYLPWFEVPSRFAPIRVRHLLAHTAGIVVGSDITSDSRYDVWALRETEAGSAPGERFRYSNVGYRALGFLIEEVLGVSYAEAVRARILEPLGMAASAPAITTDMRDRLATSHWDPCDDRPPDSARALVPSTWLETATGDGCQACTASDLACFLRALLGRGRGPTGSLISEESFVLLRGPWTATGLGWDYGYGLRTYHRGDHDLIGHGGDMVGSASSMRGEPESGYGAVALVNGLDDEELTADVVEYALALVRAVHHGRELPDEPSLRNPMPVEDASAYAGEYRSRARALTLRAEGGRVLLEVAGVLVPLEQRETDRLRADHPDFALFLLVFERDEGVVARVWYGDEEFVRDGKPLSPGPPYHWTRYTGHYRSYNPWLGSVRVVARGDRLFWIAGAGWEHSLVEVGEDVFRLGEDERDPERVRFDAFVNGRALRADLSGCAYYRVSTP